MTLHHVRRGQGSPLLLVHGLGAGWRSWEPIIDDLAARREVIAVDLPGFGESPPLEGEVSIAALADAVARFIEESGLDGVSTAGQSMGGRIVLELARRGVGGDTVALDPGGFWSDRELAIFSATLRPSIALVSAVRGALPGLLGNPMSRTVLLAQLSARPWALSAQTVLPDVAGLADAPATGPAMDALTKGPPQQGAPAGTVPGRVTIGWGRRDLVTLPAQARRAARAFPDATLHWFDRCGHFPQWDAPREAARLILDRTS
ncbi:alpha/beta fold hydrolase [Dietzia maris]|uniref:Alpha/beta hydrolase n=1 Tax=Dietzia maris TaxID=37915 RepID=A0A365PET2_9ACTN|nr:MULTISPECIES: alpha/beta fold hydrolase [Dietzia]MBB0991949.1 alpha/beta fold hydrolase [Dietzia sp. SLG510A3-30A2]HBD22175.1 alpha/beta hydrolase [Dietzia sp.]MBB0996615.1 alpha/beta fold hydrolase [Dietzia maris]MCZ4541040.1 alpha/beta fold hydrolase [Dietzia maris]MCZ4657010.1 alpha/beta fold hydrolase [Dietzia kunjamensis]